MRDDFCVFILTHGRPDRVHTYKTLMKAGYTGKVYIVIDDEDDTADEYRKRYGDKVLQFCKAEVAKTTDTGDNFGILGTITYARNVCWDLARQVGVRYFIQLDDDYMAFFIRHNLQCEYICHQVRNSKSMDDILEAMVDFLDGSGALTVAMSQGGDHLGGVSNSHPALRRKAMNSFICSTDRQFCFAGHMNEDVNTYTSRSRRGDLFFTVVQAQLTQTATQSNDGGISELYRDVGTYVKSFYSVMYAPSCVQIGVMGDHHHLTPRYRIHHKINWHHTAPKILREEHRKPGLEPHKKEQV